MVKKITLLAGTHCAKDLAKRSGLSEPYAYKLLQKVAAGKTFYLVEREDETLGVYEVAQIGKKLSYTHDDAVKLAKGVKK